jgi:Major Facilitator Superfamily
MIRSERPMDAFALVHMASAAGDALLAVALADSVFFSLPVGEARPKVALYLALTMAPLAVAAPLLVPLLDRAGPRRVVSAGAAAGRAVAATFAATHTTSLLLFPAVFVVLVLSKVHAVAKNGLVAAYVENDQTLLAANAQLGRVAAVSIALVAGPGVLILKLGSSPAVLYVSALVYLLAMLLCMRLPRPRSGVGEGVPAAEEAALVRGRVPSLATAAAGTACLRAAQGFLLFLMAFSLRTAGKPAYWLGLLVLGSVVGGYVGDVLGPRLRPGLQAQTVVLGSLILAGAGAVFALSAYGLPTLVVFSFLAGGATELGRLAFQSLMQRAAPGNLSGRVFVRYEAVFQLAWVAGALLPAMLPIPFRGGVILLAVFYLSVGCFFLARSQLAAHREHD